MGIKQSDKRVGDPGQEIKTSIGQGNRQETIVVGKRQGNKRITDPAIAGAGREQDKKRVGDLGQEIGAGIEQGNKRDLAAGAGIR